VGLLVSDEGKPNGAPFDVTTLGEVMLRLSVPMGYRLEAARSLDLHPGGAEANVLGALACLGRRCAWVSSLPANALGRMVANHLRSVGIDLTGVIWRERGRIGSYYLEFAAPPRATQAIYDRADSCAARMRPEEIDWAYLLNTRILHLSGITPALSPSCLAVTAEAVRHAREAGVPISFDVNYRQLLWSAEEARLALTPLIQGVDLLLCSGRDAVRVFGCGDDADAILGRMIELSGARRVVVTFGADGLLAWDGAQVRRQPAVPVTIVDRLGAGDGVAAGLIHGWLDGDLALGLRYGTMLAALALSQHGDIVITTPAELAALLGNAAGGLVR
jgi:2-dehydro-3-deoxygluconokinase